MIELIIGIGISTLVLSLLCSVFKISLGTTSKISNLDSQINDYQFLSLLIRDEVSSADFLYKNDEYGSLGFVILIVNENRAENNKENLKYKYVKYIKEKDKIYRYALNSNLKGWEGNRKWRKNKVAENVKSIKYKYDESKLVLDFEFNINNIVEKKNLVIANRTFGEDK